MNLLRVFQVFFSLYLSIILSFVSCLEKVYDHIDLKNEKGNRKNPYIDKFHEMAGKRPTKCQGKRNISEWFSFKSLTCVPLHCLANVAIYLILEVNFQPQGR